MRTITFAIYSLLPSLATAQSAQIPDFARLNAEVEAILEEEGTPGVGVAVISNFEILWAGGFGVLQRAEDGAEVRSVDAETLFQAGSVSKPVTAAAVLSLVEDGVLSLDEEVNAMLESWQLPGDRAESVTLRHLLSHMAGLTVDGFPGYPPTSRIPSVIEILEGRAPANTGVVRIAIEPGSRFVYSGGGMVVAQLVMEDVVGEPFAKILKEHVLDPVGMERSTFEQPLPESLWGNAAHGHGRFRDEIVDYPWRIYPELAAAGLWTTPTDLARFMLAIREAMNGERTLMSRESAQDMTSPQLGGRTGMSIGVAGSDPYRRMPLSGLNWGFRTLSNLFLEQGDGIVVMTNRHDSDALGRVRAAVLQKLGPGTGRTEVEVARDVLETYVGEYKLRPGLSLVVTLENGALFAQGTGQLKNPVFAESKTEFFLKAASAQVTFTTDDSGIVDGMTLRQNGRESHGPKVK